ncbi:MAG: hypothetical protein Q9227_001240 [Pyrenula ochraceoflavens]
MSPSIAIIGAGPSGLTLARLLENGNFPSYVIYELDASPKARFQQGGSLDLHTDTGLAALRKCGLWEQFMKHARYDGEALVIAGQDAEPLFQQGSDDAIADRPEIDRERLKEILLGSVPSEKLRWGMKLKEVTEDGRLHFVNGTVEGPFDLVVGADGAWSRVRSVLTDVRPAYSSMSGFLFNVPRPAETHPTLNAMVGQGSYFCYGESKSCQAQRLGDGSIKVACFKRAPESYPKDVIEKSKATRKPIAEIWTEENYSAWSSDVQSWILGVDDSRAQPWPLYELPVGHTWTHKPGFTLIGDSAHLCTPFAGEGVNAAMTDSMELAEAILASVTASSNLDEAISEFEQKMWPRVHKTQARTMRNKEGMFTDDAPKGLLAKMKQSFAESIQNYPEEEKKKAMEKIAELEKKLGI